MERQEQGGWDFDDYDYDDGFDDRYQAREQGMRPEPSSPALNSPESPNHEQERNDEGFGDLAWNDEGPSGQF